MNFDTVEHGPGDARHSIIWLHGLGADGHDFEPIVPELALPDVRYVFPHAPVRPVTLNNGYRMRAWFDLQGIDRKGPLDREGLEASMRLVEGLIAREIERGVPAERIVLAGFSQGGALALCVALTTAHRLAAVIGLSTFLMDPEVAGLEPADANRATPFFLAHGRQDPVVPFEFGLATRDWLAAQGFNVSWHEYDMPHTVSPQEVAALREFLSGVMK